MGIKRSRSSTGTRRQQHHADRDSRWQDGCIHESKAKNWQNQGLANEPYDERLRLGESSREIIEPQRQAEPEHDYNQNRRQADVDGQAWLHAATPVVTATDPVKHGETGKR